MTPSLKAIVERCEYDWNLNLHGPNENQRLMPIIRELCEVMEEQQKALEQYKDIPIIERELNWVGESYPAALTLDSTTKRLEQLGLGEGK
jgi:tRNA(Ile)-lysidine synthase TilS/MesJ